VSGAPSSLARWLAAFAPPPMTVARREVALGCVGAGLGVLFAAWLSHRLLGGLNPWFIAPMGASAVLLFAVPASPLAQPWSLVGGNLVSAAIGVTCAARLPDPVLAAACAAALSIGAMFALRCLHPPSGAVALTAVLGGPAVTALGYRFLLWPVAIDSLLLLLAALLFNVSARRRYPHRAHAAPNAGTALAPQDLQAALRARGELLDVSRDDLEELFVEAEHRAWQRRLGALRCEAVMARDVAEIGPHAGAQQAWALMARHGVKALPVVDDGRRLVGIVTLHDFLADHDGAGLDLATARVADLMTRDVLVARPAQPLADLVQAFAHGGRRHLPVVDAQRRLVGMVAQSDLVAALWRAGLESAA
jgi:CBS domain-containing membrane protein